MISLHNDDDINPSSQEEESERIIRINPAMKRHFELEIETLQNAPRDEGKLRQLLRLKVRKYEKATRMEEIHSLVTEIEVLKLVLCLVSKIAKAF
jgi:hypothetical protein